MGQISSCDRCQWRNIDIYHNMKTRPHIAQQSQDIIMTISLLCLASLQVAAVYGFSKIPIPCNLVMFAFLIFPPTTSPYRIIKLRQISILPSPFDPFHFWCHLIDKFSKHFFFINCPNNFLCLLVYEHKLFFLHLPLELFFCAHFVHSFLNIRLPNHIHVASSFVIFKWWSIPAFTAVLEDLCHIAFQHLNRNIQGFKKIVLLSEYIIC